MSERPAVTAVVPVYNSEPTLPDLLARLDAALAAVAPAHEIVLVEDGSRDGSWGTLERLAPRYPAVRAIRLSRNYGQHNALLCGIRAARHPVIVTLDDDLQNPPEEIGKLLDRLAEGHDVVYGVPARGQHGLARNLASRLVKFAMRHAMGTPTALDVSAFRAFRTRLRDSFASYDAVFVCVDVLLSWGTTRFTAVKVDHRGREMGQSNYSVRKLVRHAVNMITGFSVMPLQFASLLGLAFSAFGVAVLVYVVGRFLIEGVAVQGFAFTASIIAIFSGAQLFAIGIIGEYLARIHFRTMARPTYVVHTRIDGPAGEEPA